MAVNERQKQKRTPFSAKLPQASLDDVIPVVEALAELGVPSTPHVIAQQMGTSYSTNSRVRTQIGAAGYYGFIKKQGDRRVLTERGEDVTSGDENRVRQARRDAVMSTTFGPILYSLRGRNVSENTIALRLQADYGVPEGSAPTVAHALVAAATQAELATNDRFDAAAIEGSASVMPSPEEAQRANGERARKAPEQKRSTPTDGAKEQDRKETPKVATTEKEKEVKERPFVPGIQVVVKIDASTLSPQEIAELVHALQAPQADS
jgi:hypothetical protein